MVCHMLAISSVCVHIMLFACWVEAARGNEPGMHLPNVQECYNEDPHPYHK